MENEQKLPNLKLFLATMRAVALDSINNAGGGHIGMALGASEIFYSLIGQNLNFSPLNPKWINRDRFVLSAGHGSMGLYSLYHLMGLISLEDIKNHKQLHSKTPSHPEVDKLEYIDASTGPLGQGVAMAVGMALAETRLSEKFNQPDLKIIDHFTYVLCGDGDFQEGVALEALAFAGTNKLSKLIIVHDFNNIQIDTSASFVNNLDFASFFKSIGFDAIILKDNKLENINFALEKARKSDRPVYIQVPTIIAFGTEFANSTKGHHGSVSAKKTYEFKANLGLEKLDPFDYDQKTYEIGANLLEPKNQKYLEWEKNFTVYKQKYPLLGQRFENFIKNKELFSLEGLTFAKANLAIRDYVEQIIQKIDNTDLLILGGSADLGVATKTKFSGQKLIDYGIREFAMAAINNGISLYANFYTICSTFLVFSDYAKAALRLAGLMNLCPIYIFSHDSYQVGGDGPTHQPVEQLAMLRSIPNFLVIRPCDQFETLFAFNYGLNSKTKPVAIISTRQPLESVNKNLEKIDSAYYIYKTESAKINILASGSEVQLAKKLIDKLAQSQIFANLISVPILQNLVENPLLIKKLELEKLPIFAIEASNDPLWFKLATVQKFSGHFASGFGESAPGDIVYELKGFNVDYLFEKVLKFLENK